MRLFFTAKNGTVVKYNSFGVAVLTQICPYAVVSEGASAISFNFILLSVFIIPDDVIAPAFHTPLVIVPTVASELAEVTLFNVSNADSK